MKSAGCASLPRKLLPLLDHMQLDHLYFVAKDKKEPFLPQRLFFGLSPSIWFGVGYVLKFVDTSFFYKFFKIF